MESRVHSVFELEQAIERLLSEVCQKAGADAVTFHYYDETYDRLILPIGVGLKDPERFTSWLPSMDRVAGKIVRRGQPIFAEDAQHHSEVTGPFVIAEGIESSAGFPLITSSKETIGVLFFSYCTPRSFPTEEKTALETVAGEITESIHRLLTTELKTELARHPGLPREQIALQEVVDSVVRALGDAAAAIWVPERDKQSLVIKAEAGPTGEFVRGTSLSLTQSSAVVDAFRTGNPASARTEDEPAFEDQANLVRWREVWAFPVLSDSRVLAVLCVWTIDHYGLTERERAVVDAFVELTARTIENERRILTLNVLQSVGSRLTFMLAEPQRLMTEIVRSAAQVMGADNITLHQYDLERQQFYDVDRSFTYGATKPLQKPREEGGASARVRDEGLVIIENMDAVPKADREMTWTEHVKEERVEAYLGVRLRANEDVLGVLFFNYLRPRRFSPDEIAIAEMFADYASTAIYNARMYSELEESNRELRALQEFAGQISTALDLDEAVDFLLHLIHKVLGFEYATVSLVDEEREIVAGKQAMWQGQVGVFPEWGGMSIYPLDHQDIQPDIVRTGETEIIGEWDDRFNKEIWDKYNHDQLLRIFMPIRIGGRIIGTVEAGYDKANKDRIEEDEVRALRAFVDQASVALHNARLFQRERRRARDLAALNKVGQELTTRGFRLDEDEILELIYDQASTLMDTRNMYIALYDQYTDVVKFGLAFEDGERVQVGRGAWAPRTGGHGATEAIIRSKKPLLFRTAKEAEEWYTQPESKEYTGYIPEKYGYLGVPMMVGEDVLGVIAVRNHEADYVYSRDDLIALSTIASQATIALDSASLYSRLESALVVLTEVAQELSRGIRMTEKEVLELICEQAGKVMSMDNMYIAIYDESTDTVRFGLAVQDGKRLLDECFQPGSESGWAPRSGGTGRTEEIIRTKNPILHKTRAEAEDWYTQTGHEEYIGEVSASWMGVPMMVGEKALGVIVAHDPDQEYAYDEDHLQVLTPLASQAAIALENAWLYGEIAHRVEQLEVVRGISNAIPIYADLRPFLQAILDLALPHLDARAGTIQILDEGTNELVVEAATGPVADRRFTRISLDEGITGQAARERRPIYVTDVRESEDYLPYLEDTCSEMAVPLMVGDDLLGVFNLEDPRVDAFDQDTQELFELIAEQVAIAVQQKMRLEEEEKRAIKAEREAVLGRFTQDIAHYVKNQVGIVRLSAINLLNDPQVVESSDRKKELVRIQSNAERTIELAEKLFEPYRPGEKEWVNVNWLIDEAFHLVGEREGIETDLDLAQELPQVYIERQGMVGVFQELVINAYKAVRQREEPKWVRISSQHSVDGDIEVLFSNSGPPIPQERWEAIFEQFAGTEDAVVRREGFGLGLWSARVFLGRQGSEISVMESNSNQTTFVVRLPVSSIKREED